VKRGEFSEMVRENGDLPSLCSALIDLANERGGPDNVTVVAARFDGEGLSEPASADETGYQVYHVSEDQDTTDPVTPEPETIEPVPVPIDDPPPEIKDSKSGYLVAAAILALLALLLTALF
jgi:hypothetical protein